MLIGLAVPTRFVACYREDDLKRALPHIAAHDPTGKQVFWLRTHLFVFPHHRLANCEPANSDFLNKRPQKPCRKHLRPHFRSVLHSGASARESASRPTAQPHPASLQASAFLAVTRNTITPLRCSGLHLPVANYSHPGAIVKHHLRHDTPHLSRATLGITRIARGLVGQTLWQIPQPVHDSGCTRISVPPAPAPATASSAAVPIGQLATQASHA